MVDRWYRRYGRELINRIGSHDYGGWEVPWQAIFKLEIQGANGVTLKMRLKVGEPGAFWGSSQTPKTREPGVLIYKDKRRRVALEKRQTLPFPPPFCSIWALSWLDGTSSYCWGWIFCIQSTDSNASLFQKQPYRHIQQSWFMSYLGIP